MATIFTKRSAESGGSGAQEEPDISETGSCESGSDVESSDSGSESEPSEEGGGDNQPSSSPLTTRIIKIIKKYIISRSPDN